jgi:hypothetical protein
MIETLTADEFKGKRREKLLDYEIYQDEADHLVSAIPRGRRRSKNARRINACETIC